MSDKTEAGASSNPLEKKTPPYETEVSLAGVLWHARSIIEQGRAVEYLEALKANGYLSVTVPDGLIDFSRKFIADFVEINKLDQGIDTESYKYSVRVHEIFKGIIPPIDGGC